MVKNKKNKGKIITADTRLVGSMDWEDPNTSDPAEERGDDMYCLAVGFSARTCKRSASAQRETSLGSVVSDEKWPKRSSPDEEAKKCPAVIVVNSIE